MNVPTGTWSFPQNAKRPYLNSDLGHTLSLPPIHNPTMTLLVVKFGTPLLMISLQVCRLRNTCGKNEMKGKVKYE